MFSLDSQRNLETYWGFILLFLASTDDGGSYRKCLQIRTHWVCCPDKYSCMFRYNLKEGFETTSKYTRGASKRHRVLFVAVWSQPGVVCYYI